MLAGIEDITIGETIADAVQHVAIPTRSGTTSDVVANTTGALRDQLGYKLPALLRSGS